MEDYIDMLKKYKILIAIYLIIFVLILYFIWKPQNGNNASLFNIQQANEDAIYDRYYSYYKTELDKIFLEGNYEKIYNNYLLDSYKSASSITLDNIEDVIKYKCESFKNASSTKYTYSKFENMVIYNVKFMDESSENSLYIYEFSPYNFKISFGKKIYSSSEDEKDYVTSDYVKSTEDGLTFEIMKEKEYNGFIEYGITITNEDVVEANINSISNNDEIKLEKGNYIKFTASFKISLSNQPNIRKMKFLKVEKNGEEKEIEIKL